MKLALLSLWVFCLRISYGRLIDNSEEQKNVGRRPTKIVYKTDGVYDESFSISYGETQESDEYYDEGEDEYDEDSSEETYESEEDSMYKQREIDASTVEAEFVDYTARKSTKRPTKTIASKDNKQRKTETVSKGKENKDLGKPTRKKDESKNQQSKKTKSVKPREARNDKQKTLKPKIVYKLPDEIQRVKDREAPVLNARIDHIRKVEYDMGHNSKSTSEDDNFAENYRIQQEKYEKLLKEDADLEKEHEGSLVMDSKSYLRDRSVNIPEESQDEYDYSELKKQLEMAESRPKEKKRKKKFSKSKEIKSNEVDKKPKINKERRFSKKSGNKEKAKRTRSSRNFTGKRDGKSKVNDNKRAERRRSEFRDKKDPRRGVGKEGLDKYQNTDSRYGRTRQFKEMVGRTNVKQHLKKLKERQRQRRGRTKNKKNSAVAAKQKRDKMKNIRRDRKRIGNINKKSEKIKRKRH